MFKHMTKCDILSVPFQKTFSLLVPTISCFFCFFYCFITLYSMDGFKGGFYQ